MKGIFFMIIFMIIVTVFMPMFIVTSCDMSIPKKDKLPEKQIIESDLIIPIYNHEDEETMNLNLEEYIIGVVAAEAPAAFEMEALKAQAVAARTYAIWKRVQSSQGGNTGHEECIVCTSHLHCQAWLSKEELRERHGKKWMDKYYPKIEEAVLSTRGVVITYNMEPIEPLYHSTSGGRTENSEDVFAKSVPYLVSVPSPYEQGSPVLVDTHTISTKDFTSKFKKKYEGFKINEKKIESEISIVERSQGGNIKKIKIGNKEFTGRQVRELLDLRSSDFTIDFKGSNLQFTTKGYGHGVGMSQWGANGMAKEGKEFDEILKHYYQGASLSVLKSHREQ